jgi:MerR family transcriptional regulator, copper efflux regulator
MSTFTIGQVADRTGFSASALRYYEGLGVVTPAARTEAGYRLYDDATLRRLTFIGRAKQLGCSLDEITDLLAVRNGEQCGPVQRRLHGLITDKIRATQDQLAELTAFGAQLQSAAARLDTEPIDGPCGDECACVSDGSTTSPTAAPVVLVASPASDPPIACTLEPDAMPDRLADWQTLLNNAKPRSLMSDGRVRIELDDDVDLGELARLARAEQHCCAFFSFTLTLDMRGIALEVGAPDVAADLVHTVFGNVS